MMGADLEWMRQRFNDELPERLRRALDDHGKWAVHFSPSALVVPVEAIHRAMTFEPDQHVDAFPDGQDEDESMVFTADPFDQAVLIKSLERKVRALDARVNKLIAGIDERAFDTRVAKMESRLEGLIDGLKDLARGRP